MTSAVGAVAFFFGALAMWLSALAAVILMLDARWRPIIRAYLEAKARAAGSVMRVEEPDAPPGKLYAPTWKPPDEDDAA